MDEEPDYLPPGPRAELRETAVLDDWRKAEAGNAARLASGGGAGIPEVFFNNLPRTATFD